MKKKIVVFTGAGISQESGISTFRDIDNGLWYNYKVDDVATVGGWKKDKAKVLEFHNMLRSKLPTVEPNDAHRALVKLEKHFDVVTITQNVDDLHERAGSSNIIHLHGELTKARGCNGKISTKINETVYDIGYNEINLGDTCEESGKQLRPHIVWFGEYPFMVDEAYNTLMEADILIIIGTSLQIGYTLLMLGKIKKTTKVYYVDPNPTGYLTDNGFDVEYIQKKATEGVVELVDNLIKNNMYRPLPSYLTIKPSDIEGLGVFATDDIDVNHVIGITHIKDIRFEDGYSRTPLGGFINHSKEPNVEFYEDELFMKVRTIKEIKAGEELVAFYQWYDPTK